MVSKSRLRRSGKSGRKQAFWRVDPIYRSAIKPAPYQLQFSLDSPDEVDKVAEPRASANANGCFCANPNDR